jgi:hypothetical protein
MTHHPGRIPVIGASGLVALPVAREQARDNEMFRRGAPVEIGAKGECSAKLLTRVRPETT